MIKNTRILFNKPFYALQGILISTKFDRMFMDFRKEMESKGLLFPSSGFKTVREYHEWGIKAHAKEIYYEGFLDSVIKEFNVEKEHKDKFQLGLQWYVYFGKKKAPIKFTHGKQINISNELISQYNPCWLFIATPNGFFFDSCNEIISREGNIKNLTDSWVNKAIQNEYSSLLQDFITH